MPAQWFTVRFLFIGCVRSRVFVCPLYQEWEGTDEDTTREEILEVGGF